MLVWFTVKLDLCVCEPSIAVCILLFTLPSGTIMLDWPLDELQKNLITNSKDTNSFCTTPSILKLMLFDLFTLTLICLILNKIIIYFYSD
jgi:hypothetical protein